MKWGYKVLLVLVCSFVAVLILHAVIQYLLTSFIQWGHAILVSVIFGVIFASISSLHFLFPPKGKKSFLGMPYNFKFPTKKRILRTYWNKDAKLFKPKLWGIGWDMNLRSPWSWAIIGLVILISVFALYHQDKITQLDTSLSIPLDQRCNIDSDCIQPRCPGLYSTCILGECLIKSEEGMVDNCVDLKLPICGNSICEGAETSSNCPEDCEEIVEEVDEGSLKDLSITKVACEASGAFWNECSSPCLGTDAELCTMNCVTHCECDVKTRNCPNSHVCMVGKFDLERGVCI